MLFLFHCNYPPPVRTRIHPKGVPWASPDMQRKIDMGNSHCWWCARVVRKHIAVASHFWIENPSSSWLWKQTPWTRIIGRDGISAFIVDYCQMGMPWRKRTKFVTNIPALMEQRLICSGNHSHQVLRGSAKGGVPWTRVAEPYPYLLCDLLATAACVAAKWHKRAEVRVDDFRKEGGVAPGSMPVRPLS